MSSSGSVPTVTLVVRNGRVYFVSNNDMKNTFVHPPDEHHQARLQNNEQSSGSDSEDDPVIYDEIDSADFADEVMAELRDARLVNNCNH